MAATMSCRESCTGCMSYGAKLPLNNQNWAANWLSFSPRPQSIFVPKIPAFDRNKLHARLVLAMLFLATGLFVAITFSPLKSGFADAPNRGPGDIELYRAEVDRIHAGESYYDTIAAELRARGYPTRSVFNWRMPLPVWFIGV